MNEHDRYTADDEALSALLDGALPAEQAEQLRQRLSAEPALAARWQALNNANTTVRDAYSGIADEPLPAGVLALLQAGDEHGEDRAANVIAFAPRTQPRIFAIPASIAAGIALAVGLALGIALGPRMLTPEPSLSIAAAGAVEPGSALHDALEMVPSAQTRELAAQLSATLRLTFKTLDGDYCRHVDFAGAGGTTAALACRRDGSWRLEVASFIAQVSAAPDGLYRPAAGRSSAVEDAIDSSIEGVALEAGAESELIARRWMDAP
jgi:hypothetical protein